MKSSFSIFAALASAVLASPTGKYKFKSEDIIERDVVILGGGAAGVYALARVLDANKTGVLIEKENHLVSAVSFPVAALS